MPAGHKRALLLPFCSRLSKVIPFLQLGLQTQHAFLQTTLQQFTSASTDYIHFCLQTPLWITWLLLESLNGKTPVLLYISSCWELLQSPRSFTTKLQKDSHSKHPSFYLWARQHNLVSCKKLGQVILIPCDIVLIATEKVKHYFYMA